MTAATLYARYSTAMQSVASVDDQFRLLRQRAAREGWSVTAEHADRAISGTVRDRPGLDGALADLEAGRATILLAESLDRISRDQEDLAAIFKRVRFQRARIVTLAEGEIGTIHVGMGGTVSAIFLEQLAEKTRRGQIGRVEAGRVPGGLSYGYRKVHRLDARGEPERGLREIDESQAAIVRRIFTDYVSGLSPLQIAAALNAEGVPSPRGGLWRANTIGGHRQRGNGILHNQLYAGRILFNRQSFRKDPETRKRVSRVNDQADLVAAEVPDLRIIDDALWQAAQSRLAAYSGHRPEQARRPKRLLSGLMRCGICGGNVTIIGVDRWGCSVRQQTRTCSNTSTISDRQAQQRLWRAIQHNLLHEDLVAVYVEELRQAIAERRRSWLAERAGIERRIAELEAEGERIVDAIVAGVNPARLKDRSHEVEAEREQLLAHMQSPEWKALDRAIAHPALAERYRRNIARLHELASATSEVRAAGRKWLAEIIDYIELTPRAAGRGADLTVHGNLAAILQIPETQKSPAGRGLDCMSTVVAGVGFEPTTFRL